jgi:spore coat protein U-like protein
MRNVLRVLSVVLAAGLMPMAVDGARAATVSGSFGVSVTVDPTCYLSTDSLSFGTYHQGGGDLAGSTTLSLRCTRGLTFVISLDPGSAAGTSLAQRLMVNGAHTLQYNLYTSLSHTTVWGDGTGGSATVSGTGLGTAASKAVSETVYGEVPDSPANQALPPGGTYTDTITVTVNY